MDKPDRSGEPPIAKAPPISAEVAVAFPDQQVVVPVTLPAGSTIADAIRESGLAERFPALEISPDRIGVFAELRRPFDPVEDGDRVEIYRLLTADPFGISFSLVITAAVVLSLLVSENIRLFGWVLTLM
ncbi:MAG: RnfH family protein, partial [Pseudomonadota bacterium]